MNANKLLGIKKGGGDGELPPSSDDNIEVPGADQLTHTNWAMFMDNMDAYLLKELDSEQLLLRMCELRK